MHVTTRWNAAATILDGMISGWVLTLASVAALVAGVAVGLISAAGAEMGHIGYAIIGVLLFPAMMFSSLPRFIVGLWMLWVVLRYWTEEERRLERLYAIMCLSSMMVWAALGYEYWGPGVAVTALVLAGGYVAFRLWPDWSIRRLEEKADREIAEIRRERLAEVRQAVQGDVSDEASPAGQGDQPLADQPPPRPHGLGLLEVDEPGDN